MKLALIPIAALLVSTATARSEGRADNDLVAPEERAWFDKQPSAMKEQVLKGLRSAHACVDRFRAKNGAEDARIASLPRFLTGVFYGVVVHRTVPGIDQCQPPFAGQGDDSGFVVLDEAYFGPPRTMALQTACSLAANAYASDFNREVARRYPEALHRACPKGKPAEASR